MEQSEDIAELAKALAAFQKDMPTVAKTKDNPFFKSKYADLSVVVQTASPITSEHGLSVTQLPDFDGEHDLLTTQLSHTSGQWVRASMRLTPVKQDPQGFGSAISYCRRYAFCAILGIVADEDDDGNAASTPPQRAQGATKKAAAPARPAPAGNGNGSVNLNRLYAIIRGNKAIPSDDSGRHAWAATVLGKPVASFKDLTMEDASLLEKAAKESTPVGGSGFGHSEEPF